MTWHKTKYPGVRYREHATRKHGVHPDRYFVIRYKQQGVSREEGLGWASEKGPDGKALWTAEIAARKLAELKKAYKEGEGKPTRLSEARQAEQERRKREAEEKARQEQENLTFGQFFRETYYPISKTSKKRESYKKEEEHFRLYLEPILGDKPLREIKPLTIERVKKSILDAGRSPRFLQYCLATFRQVWNMARRNGLVAEESPTRGVKIPTIENKRTRFLSPVEAGELLAYLKPRNPTIHDMAFLSLFSGMRLGECIALKWGAVDLDRGLITIYDAKGGKTRTAFMTPEIREMFSGRRRGEPMPEELVFPTGDGHEYADTPTTFRDAVEALGFNENVSDPRQRVVFHTLRHTFASWQAEAGTDIYTIGKLLGHSTVQMSARYAHLGAGAMQEAMKRLPALPTGEPAAQIKVVKLRKKT